MIEALTTAQHERWGHVEELLATVVEELDAVIRILIMANSDPKKKPKLGAPFVYPRPGRVVPRRKVVHPRDIARRLLAGGR